MIPHSSSLVQVRGSLSQTKDPKKYETYWIRLKDSLLMIFEATAEEDNNNNNKDLKKKKSTRPPTNKEESTLEKLIELVPLTNIILEEPTKKDKPPTKFAFVLNNPLKKWRIVFSLETEEDFKQWQNAIEKSLLLASSNIFSTTLSDACLKSNSYLPDIIRCCISHTSQYLQVEGIYRVPGDKNQVAVQKDLFEKGFEPDLSKCDTHLVCGLLKLYLREIGDPVIPQSHYKQLMLVQSVADLHKLIKDLPVINRCTLCYIIDFFVACEKESKYNLMDAKNLATVFGPTVIRNPAAGENFDLEEMALSTTIIKMMIDCTMENKESLFSQEDREKCEKPIFDCEAELSKVRPSMLEPERLSIEAYIAPHQGIKLTQKENIWESNIAYLVNIVLPKTKANEQRTTEPRIFVADKHRVYIFLRGGGRPEFEFHYIELKELDSPSKAQLTLSFENAGVLKQVTILPISFASYDIDKIVGYIYTQYEETFIGIPSSHKYKLTLAPEHRKKEILGRTVLADKQAGCAGLVRTYISICDWMGVPILDPVVWDLENFFRPNNLKTFNIYDIIQKDKYPNEDFRALMHSLRFNIWFDRIDTKACILGNDGLAMVADVMKTNSTITTLDLKDTGASTRAVQALCEAFAENPGLALKNLNLSGNSFEVKFVTTFSQTLSDSLGKLTKLDISNIKLTRVAPILEALGRTVALVNSLTELNLSQNCFRAECCNRLGTFLTLTRALRTLSISGTSMIWQNVVEGMTDNKKQKNSNSTVTCLDISNNPTKAKQQLDLQTFLEIMPKVEKLNLTKTEIGCSTLVLILQKNGLILNDLDISENDYGDDGVIAIMKVVEELSIKKLALNKSFSRRGKTRQLAMESICSALTKAGITHFSINNSKLKGDLLDMMFGLIYNTALQYLDISGNQSGDPLASALSKILQQNNSLHTILWDNNETTLTGLKSILLGLERNKSIKYMPLPVTDIGSILKNKPDDAELVYSITKEIQHRLYESSQQALLADLTPYKIKLPCRDLKMKDVVDYRVVQVFSSIAKQAHEAYEKNQSNTETSECTDITESTELGKETPATTTTTATLSESGVGFTSATTGLTGAASSSTGGAISPPPYPPPLSQLPSHLLSTPSIPEMLSASFEGHLGGSIGGRDASPSKLITGPPPSDDVGPPPPMSPAPLRPDSIGSVPRSFSHIEKPASLRKHK